MLRAFVIAMLGAAAAAAAEPSSSMISKSLENDLSGVEKELVALVEAMPANKFDFAPTQGEFKGVRTFRQQATHVATTIFMLASAITGEANTHDAGKEENGPASIQSKDDVVNYVKAAFANGHAALKSITDQNATELVKSAFGNRKVPRISMATLLTSHSFDHYGQMVVYARMNGVVPPASRR